MAIVLWILVLGLVAAGSALLICFMMRCRIEEALAQERGALTELRSTLFVKRHTIARAIHDAKAEVKRAAFDEYFNDFKVEQQYYVRRSKLFFLSKQTLVMRERILFRNLPISKWVENAMTIEETAGPGYSLSVAGFDASLAREISN